SALTDAEVPECQRDSRHSMWSQFLSYAHSESCRCGFRRVVEDVAKIGPVRPGHRVHDQTTVLEHQWCPVPRRDVAGSDPGAEHGVPAPAGLLEERGAEEGNRLTAILVSAPRIIDQDVEAPVVASYQFEYATNLLIDGVVARNGSRSSSFGADPGSSFLQRLNVAARHVHNRAGRSEFFGDSPHRATTGARHYAHPSLELSMIAHNSRLTNDCS